MRTGDHERDESAVFAAAWLLYAGSGLYFLWYAVLQIVDRRMSPFVVSREKAVPARNGLSWYQRPALLVFPVCLLCWLPYWFADFPAVMTVDSFNQYAQATGVYAYSNHHPWLHTLLLQACVMLGRMLAGESSGQEVMLAGNGWGSSGSQLGIAVFIVLQMRLMAGCAAYLIRTMEQCGVRRRWQTVALLFYAVLPFQGMFVVTVWKDILFAGAVLLFGLTVFRMQTFGVGWKELGIYAAGGCLVSLLRSNGWYAFLVTVPFLLLAFREQIRKLLPVNLFIIAVVILIKGPVMSACGVTQPDLVESLSVPLQQIARVVADGGQLNEKEMLLLTQVIDEEQVKEDYDPRCSDNIKRLIRKKNPGYLSAHTEQYRSFYVSLFKRYPQKYYQAWLDLTSAYWYPEVKPRLVFNEGIPENEFGLESTSVFHGNFYLKGKEIFFKLYEILPGYGLFFSIGLYTWLLIVQAGYCFRYGKDRRWAVLLLPVGLTATLMIATPLNGEFRYAYPVVFSMPLYFLAAGTGTERKRRYLTKRVKSNIIK